MRPFVVYQGRWSAANRDFERDIIPMCRDEGMGIAPWGALGGGHFKTQAMRDEMEKTGDKGRVPMRSNENAEKVSAVLEKIAKTKGANIPITSIALAYVMHKTPYVFPIVGGRKVDHLKGNIEALGIELSPEEMKEIDGAAPFDIGFPFNTFGTGPVGHFLLSHMGNFDYVSDPQPIKPHKA